MTNFSLLDTPLLDTINSPSDLRRLSVSQLPALCDELRACLLETVAQTGGHLASGLGVVELTVAIHYVFDTPNDSLIWDVGHQAYPHKMLTGRRHRMATLKKRGGLSGFPKRDESRYDAFGVGHSSTSIAAALGMAIADKLLVTAQTATQTATQTDRAHAHIAVIGDGAMTAGMAFEALQHTANLTAAHLAVNLLVILNDNGMSISPNIEATFVGSSKLFEALGFADHGVVDGHDVVGLVETLETLKRHRVPRLLHVKTVKGKGYAKAEAAPIAYHGVPTFNVAKGMDANSPTPMTFTQVFSQWLVDTAHRDARLLGITPAMREGSGLVAFSEQFPDRYFDVGIAEQHAVTLAAGMACKGGKPVVAIYSTFLQRAYDQLVHDVALQNLDVLFAVDRAGVVGEDGATHAGLFDLAFARCVPNLVVMTPSDADDMTRLLNTGYHYAGPALVRYPKSTITEVNNSGNPNSSPKDRLTCLPIGKAKVVRRGTGLAILVFGTLLSRLQHTAEVHDATLVDMRFVKPLDTAVIAELAQTHRYFVTVEEGCQVGGVGEQVRYLIGQQQASARVLCLGIADEFPPHGKRDEVLAHLGLDASGFRQTIDDFLHDK